MKKLYLKKRNLAISLARKLVFPALLLLTCCHAYSQSRDISYRNEPLGNFPLLHIDRVEYIHDNLSWMMGDGGGHPPVRLCISTDNWETWNTINLPYVEDLLVKSTDSIYIVNRGIFFSADAGQNWEKTPNTTIDLNGKFLSLQDLEYKDGVFAAVGFNSTTGLTVLYSIDGGESYTQTIIEPNIPEYGEWQISMETAQKWWVNKPDGRAYMFTEDGGETWSLVQEEIYTKNIFQLEDGTTLYAKGWTKSSEYDLVNFVKGTTDGGLSYQDYMPILAVLDDSLFLNFFQNQTLEYAYEATLVSEFQGFLWRNILGNNFDLLEDLAGIYMTKNDGKVYAFFEDGRILVSEDRLLGFSSVTDRKYFLDEAGFRGDFGVAIDRKPGNDDLFLSYDHGISWESLALPEGDFLGDYFFIHPDTIEVATYNNTDSELIFSVTHNQGQSYTELFRTDFPLSITGTYISRALDGSYYFHSVEDSLYFIDRDRLNGILKNDNTQGVNFRTRESGVVIKKKTSDADLREVNFTVDGGETWYSRNLSFKSSGEPMFYPLSNGEVIIQDENIGWVISNNLGTAWDTVVVDNEYYSPRFCEFMEFGRDSLLIFNARYPDFAYASIDNGLSWTTNAAWAYNYLDRFANEPVYQYVDHLGQMVKTSPCISGSPDFSEDGDVVSVEGNYSLVSWNLISNFLEKYPETTTMDDQIYAPEIGNYNVVALEPDGCQKFGAYKKSQITSRIDALNSSLSVFPVPATTGTLEIRSLSDLKITQMHLYNSAGEQIKILNPSATSHDISKLENGVYILKIQTSDGEISKRITVIN